MRKDALYLPSPRALPERGDQMVIAHPSIGSGDGPGAGQAGLAGHNHLWLLRQHLGRKMGPWFDVFGATEPIMPRRLDLGHGPRGRACRYSSCRTRLTSCNVINSI